MQAVNVLPVVEDEEQAEAEHSHDVSRQRQQEEEEVAVVPPADAVVHPWTVVVEVLHYYGLKTQRRTVWWNQQGRRWLPTQGRNGRVAGVYWAGPQRVGGVMRMDPALHSYCCHLASLPVVGMRFLGPSLCFLPPAESTEAWITRAHNNRSDGPASLVQLPKKMTSSDLWKTVAFKSGRDSSSHLCLQVGESFCNLEDGGLVWMKQRGGPAEVQQVVLVEGWSGCCAYNHREKKKGMLTNASDVCRGRLADTAEPGSYLTVSQGLVAAAGFPNFFEVASFRVQAAPPVRKLRGNPRSPRKCPTISMKSGCWSKAKAALIIDCMPIQHETLNELRQYRLCFHPSHQHQQQRVDRHREDSPGDVRDEETD
ncbi:hypothetical protein INR49_002062 [Caranx melampygus]|nr:hypothetical protein INR49_002062 [Caranx melampygus]